MCDTQKTLSFNPQRPEEGSPVSGSNGVAATRRSILKSTLALGSVAATVGALGRGAMAPAYGVGAAPAQSAGPAPTGDRLVMLGVGGGPVVAAGQAKPALALVVNNSVYLIDCGLDTTRQLVASGLGFGNVKNAFITHRHLDHTSGVPDLALHGWVGRPPLTSLDLWGPPGMKKMVAGIHATFADEVRLFSEGGGFGVFPTLEGHSVSVPKSGKITHVMEDDNVVVEATRVYHGPEVDNAYAYRFTLKSSGKTVVFSGDTAAPDQNLISLAQGCDVLVHETQDNDAVDRVAANLPPEQGEALRQHLYEAHSNVLDLPEVAKSAGAKKLVLNHYTPVVHPAATWLAMIQPAAEKVGYAGQIEAPMDLGTVAL